MILGLSLKSFLFPLALVLLAVLTPAGIGALRRDGKTRRPDR